MKKLPGKISPMRGKYQQSKQYPIEHWIPRSYYTTNHNKNEYWVLYLIWFANKAKT